jgi:membrane protein DedA with SNARE-associated domain
MSHHITSLIAHYGYLVTFAGSLIEGETVLILSGLAAHRGYLVLPGVIAIGTLGGAIGDIFYFVLGRQYGPALLARYPRFEPAAARVRSMVERFPNATIIGIRFMYGLRSVGPAVIGTTRIASARFMMLNALGAFIWSSTWVLGGYFLGTAAERLLSDIEKFEHELLAVGVVLAIIATIALRIGRARAHRGYSAPQP